MVFAQRDIGHPAAKHRIRELRCFKTLVCEVPGADEFSRRVALSERHFSTRNAVRVAFLFCFFLLPVVEKERRVKSHNCDSLRHGSLFVHGEVVEGRSSGFDVDDDDDHARRPR